VSAFYNILDDYWLWKEVYSSLGVSNPTYRYWDRCEYIKLGPRYVFIKRHTLPEKHRWVESTLTNLDGYLPTQYASNMLNADSHLFNYKRMALYNRFEYKFVNNIKFVNIRRFFLENNIKIAKESYIQLAPINKLHLTEDSTFYRINDQYGLVVYDSLTH
jgi:hypothetical protein